MSHKIAKKIRKSMHNKGIDPRDAQYEVGAPPQYVRFSVNVDTNELEPDFKGNIIQKVKGGKPTTLVTNCGRAQYKVYKRFYNDK